uniref:RRM domain-containing protein n=1 Tax=Schistocephalus solidus TaxID=70667 RepID=A0A0X3PVA4_SCHSO
MADYVIDAVHEGDQDEFVEEASKEESINSDTFEADIEAMKERLKEMEADANKLHNISSNVERSSAKSNVSVVSEEEKAEVDLRSIYVGNVDYGSTAEELEAHFRCCGAINRVTILCDRYTGHPKGFAYIEFESEDAIEAAVALDDSNFRGRPLKVMPKRTNLPGLSNSSRFRGRMRRRFNPYGIRAGYGFIRPRTSRFRRRRIYISAPY